MLKRHKYELLKVSKYLVADAWFSKYEFTHEIMKMGFHLVSRLRDDSILYYIDPMQSTKKKRGRKRKWDGKVDPDNLRLSKMEEVKIEGTSDKIYTAIVYCKAIERKIRLAVLITKKERPKLFFSTDTEMSGKDVIEYYRVRFQIEFNYRDGKQFTGLKDCQARNEERLDFAFNASLAAINVAKILRKEVNSDLSIGRLKTLMGNTHFLQRILRMCGIRPNMALKQQLNKHILGLVDSAA